MSNKKKVYQYLGAFFCLWMIYILIRHIEGKKIKKQVENPLNDTSFSANSTPDSYINEMKHILIWTHNYTDPINRFRSGREVFFNCKCAYNNCYVTSNRNYLTNIDDWDALFFHAPEYTWPRNPWHHGMPASRGSKQIYIFSTVESAANYPVADTKWNSYFNWTMTYRIDSDVPWFCFVIKDKNGTVIGPAKNITWIADTENNLSDSERQALKTKNKAVAWLVSNCKTLSNREKYVNDLGRFLNAMNLSVDIYGRCGNLKCPTYDNTTCWEQLSEQYYFYLSLENSFSEDYVTEKFLNPLQNGIVPIVWGGSDYSRYAPPNSYINARDHTPEELAKIIQNLMNNRDDYEKYYNWRKYYTYSKSYDSPETNAFCRLCKALNTPSEDISKTYTNFLSWWNR